MADAGVVDAGDNLTCRPRSAPVGRFIAPRGEPQKPHWSGRSALGKPGVFSFFTEVRFISKHIAPHRSDRSTRANLLGRPVVDDFVFDDPDLNAFHRPSSGHPSANPVFGN